MIDLEEKVEVPNNPGYYINRKGEVFNSFGLKLKPGKHRQGYTNFKLNGKAKYLHRLLAKAFIPNPDKDKVYINHIDGDVTNNELTNLEWVTPSENAVHAYETGLISSNIPIEVKDRLGHREVWESAETFAKAHGVSRETLQSSIRRIKGWNGFKIRYLR